MCAFVRGRTGQAGWPAAVAHATGADHRWSVARADGLKPRPYVSCPKTWFTHEAGRSASTGECGVWPARIVLPHVATQGAQALGVARVGSLVGPLPEERLDDAFGLTIRLRAVRPRVLDGDAVPASDAPDEPGAVVEAVVGEDPPHAHAMGGEVGDRPLEEGGRGRRGLVSEGLDVEIAAVVVDGDVEQVEAVAAGAPVMAPERVEVAATAAGHACETFDVEVEHLPRRVVFVAHGRARHAVEQRQAVQPGALEHPVDRRRREGELPGDPLWAAAGLAAGRDDRCHRGRRERPCEVQRPATARPQAGDALVTVATEPAMGGLAGDIGHPRGFGDRDPLRAHALHQRQLGVVVKLSWVPGHGRGDSFRLVALTSPQADSESLSVSTMSWDSTSRGTLQRAPERRRCCRAYGQPLGCHSGSNCARATNNRSPIPTLPSLSMSNT